METAYTFDDVMFVPQYSDIESRSEVDLEVRLGNITLELPVISANMADITEMNMAKEMRRHGGLGILHRFMSIEDNVRMFKEAVDELLKEINPSCSEVLELTRCETSKYIGVSVGVGDEAKKRFEALWNVGARTFCIDVAHGHHINVKKMLEWINGSYNDKNMTIIVGNIASVEGALDLYAWGARVIKAGVGPGCFSAGTRILMRNGTYKNIEEINPGDFVVNKNGDPVKVKRAFSTGFKNVSKLRSSTFYKPTYVTPDHKYFIGDLKSISKKTLGSCGYVKLLDRETKTGESKLKWKMVKDFDREVLLTPKNINFNIGNDFSIELNKCVGGFNIKKYKLDYVLKPNYGLGYIFGTFLGDGNSRVFRHKRKIGNRETISESGSVCWSFGIEEENIVLKLTSFIKDIFKRQCKVKYCGNIINVFFYYKPFANFLESFEKRNKKHLPNEYLVNNFDYLSGILHGLIDSDGHVEKNGRVNFTNTSIELIELFGIVCYLTKGFFPNSVTREMSIGNLINCNIENCKTAYRSRINTTGHKRLSKDYQISKILECERTDKYIEVFDLEVDCPTHSFIANNAIVHNSCCQTRENTGVGVPQLYVLEKIRQSLPKDASIIADGGIKKTGDIAKALKYTDAVMLGSFLAGTSETPGHVYEDMNQQWYKTIAGSASAESKVKSGKNKTFVEGGIRQVPFRGKVKYILRKIQENVQSSLSYSGARTLEEFKEKSVLIKISGGGKKESKL